MSGSGVARALKDTARGVYRALPLLPLLKLARRVGRPSFYRYLSIDGPFSTPLPDGGRLLLTARHDLYIEKELFWSGLGSEFEPATLRLWWELAETARVVVDAGANTGLFSLLAAHRNPSAEIHAFEPVDYNAEIFQCNIDLNGATGIRLHRAALSAHAGAQEMFVVPGEVNYMNSLDADRTRGRGSATEVPTLRLDELLAREGAGPVDLVKVDVEGHEDAVFEGMGDRLAASRPHIVVEVLNEEVGRALTTRFDRLGGYRYFWIDEETGELRAATSLLTGGRRNAYLSPDGGGRAP